MTIHHFHVDPRDLLFMRDARPMAASDAGIGSNLPRPDQIYYAFINAFHKTWPAVQPWEHNHLKREDENQDSSCRFGGLKTAGPFPVDVVKGRNYLPCPLDLSADEQGTLHQMLVKRIDGTNLPKPLTHGFFSTRPGKQKAPDWITLEDYSRYLEGKPFSAEKHDLFDAERNIGIGIDPDTHATIERQFYQAEYLRLRHNTVLSVAASCETRFHSPAGMRSADVFAQYARDAGISWDAGDSADLILGGQQGVVSVRKGSFRLPLPLLGSGAYLRWTLLAPALYPRIGANSAKGVPPHHGGWLPSWIDPMSGQVMLPRRKVEQLPGEKRNAWRARVRNAEKFSARLIAARIGKPLVFSGWDLQTGPKPTLHAVPAGSAYVFACRDREELIDLSNALSWNGGSGDAIRNRCSGIFGEKGYGIGVCSAISM